MKQKKPPIKPRSRECAFCKAKVEPVWSDTERLKEYLSARSKILTSKFTGVCVKHQKRLAVAVKRARHLALLPFTTQE
ncbi:MAG: 30S ribosomal protein S18 [Microgenomates group bacterium]